MAEFLDRRAKELETLIKNHEDSHEEEDGKHERNYSQMTQELNRWRVDLLTYAHDIAQELDPQLPESVTLDTAPWLYEAHTAFQSMDVGGLKESDWAQAVPVVLQAYLTALENTCSVPIDGDEGGTEDSEVARKDLVQQWYALAATQDMASIAQAGRSSSPQTDRENETMTRRETRSTARKREGLDSLDSPSKGHRQ